MFDFRKVLSWLLVPIIASTNSLLPAIAATPVSLAPPKPGVALLEQQKKQAQVVKAPNTVAKPFKRIEPCLRFSDDPSDLELETARVFSEPLVAMTSAKGAGENKALADALLNYKKSQNLSVFDSFMSQYPASRWTPSLELNIALIKFQTGHLSVALKMWQEVWNKSKSEFGQRQVAIANRAMAKLLVTHARLGHMKELKSLLAETEDRAFFGADTEMVTAAKQGLHSMNVAPQRSFKCGPYALLSILRLHPPVNQKAIDLSCSTQQGMNLKQVRDLSTEVGLNYQVAKRSKGAKIIVPSVMHWSNHFAAVVKQDGDKYILNDPTFDTDAVLGIESRTIDEESDGYFLVPAGALPTGWTAVSDDEAANVWGRGIASRCNNWNWPPCSRPCCKGMAVATFRDVSAGLSIADEPLSYSPPLGPGISFRADYEQFLPFQPATFNFTNTGANWRNNFVCYVTIDPMTSVATIRTPDDGTEIDTPSGGVYAPNLYTQAVFVNAGSGVYQRRLPDGSMEVYGQPDGSGNIFMTQKVDPQGNAVTLQYDVNFRLSTITDAIGQVSTISYVSNTVGNSGFYLVSVITDPFGRTASFAYDSTNTNLIKITDCIGIQSQFSYDTSSTFISTLQTPYGTTGFETYVPSYPVGQGPANGIRFNYPDGSREVAENWLGEPKTTYYWDREATAMYPLDPGNKVYTHSRNTRFVIETTSVEGPVKQNQKQPLENSTVYYTYPNQSDTNNAGSINKPTSISQALGTFPSVITISGTMVAGDYLRLFAPGVFIDYTIQAGDTPATAAAAWAALINSQPAIQKQSIVLVPSGNTISIVSDGPQITAFDVSASGSEVVKLQAVQQQTNDVVVGGTVATGDVISCYIGLNIGHGVEFVSYTTVAGDTTASVAAGLAAAVNADTTLQAAGITSLSTGSTWTILSYVPYPQTTPNPSTTGSETFARTLSTNGSNVNWNYQYNSIGKVTQVIDPTNRKFSYQYDTNNIDLLQITETQYGDNFLIGAWTYNSQHEPLTYKDGSGQITHYAYNSSRQLISITDANSNVTTMTYKGTSSATIGGTKTTGNVLTITVHDAGLTGGQKSINYTVVAADTLTTIATNLAAAITADTNLQSIGVSATSSGAVITLNSTSTNVTTYTQSVSGGATETIVLGANKFGFLSSVDGPLSGSKDVTNYSYDSVGRVSSITDSEGYVLSYSYDNADRPTATTYPDGTNEQTVYDRLDAVFQKDRIGRWTQSSFDSMDRVSFQLDPLGRKTSYTWCICGALAALTDGNNHTTSWSRDLQERVTKKTYADGTSVNYSYDPFISRVRKRTDAMNQQTYYMYNSDNTFFQTGYLNAVNPTGAITNGWDSKFKRLKSVGKSDWGTYTYTYNNYVTPTGAATTGGGMLQLVHNNVIPNSDVSYSYDNLARTTNRSINGASNAVSWSYDAMSRITNETNALGSFGYNYVDDVSGSSKGTTRLSSINYPNGQQTNYDWYPNIGDQRLKQIANLKATGGATLSQFNYGYNPAGEITQWEQQQNGNNIFYNLGYDRAGQLTSAVAGSGAPQSPPASEYYYSYDAGANRTSVQTANAQTVRVGGTKTTGDVLTVTATDAALPGGQKAVSYTVLAGDTLSSIALGLATAMNKDTDLQTLGVAANAHGSNTYVNIRSASNNITTYALSKSTGATETLTAGIFENGVTNVTVGGAKTTGDVMTLIVKDSALTGGQKTLTYTVLSSDSLSTIATALKNAVNADTNLAALGVTATVVGANVSIASTSTNATTYAASTNSTATETLAVTANVNALTLGNLGGTKTTGDILTITVYDTALGGGKQAIPYTVASADTLSTIAAGLASAINASTALQNIAVTASASGNVVSISSKSINQTTYVQSYSASATESLLFTTPTYGWQVANIGGSKTTGDVLSITAYNALLSGGKETASYTVVAADTPTTIATGLASAVNADTNLSAIGISASASSTVLSMESLAPEMTTYSVAKNSSATETIALTAGYGLQNSSYNTVNELTGIAAGGSALFQGTTDKPVKSASISTQTVTIQAALPSTAPNYSATVSKTPSETFTVALVPGSVFNAQGYVFTFGGTLTPGDVYSATFNDVRLPGGSETVSYTVRPGDTITSAISNFASAVDADPVLSAPGIAYQDRGSTASTVTIGVPGNPIPVISVTTSVSAKGSENVALSDAGDENTKATISGTVTTGDTISLTAQDAALANGAETVTHVVTSGETATTIASALASAVNADSTLQAVGISATSSGASVTLAKYTYFTTSVGSGTETLSVVSANRGSAQVTVGGTVTTGNVLSVTAHNATLPSGQETVSYTVVAGDTLLSIAQALTAAINVDTTLQTAKISAGVNARLLTTQSFQQNARLNGGSNLSAASAVDGSNNTKINGYATAVNGGAASTLTFDLNGNMTSDGTNSYAWDAENRMINITYPGSGNYSSFVYDGFSRNVSIIETAAGSVTSFEQFLWCQLNRKEVRTSSGSLTKQFFGRGQINGSTKFFITADHLGSITDMTDVTGSNVAQYIHDPFGRTVKPLELTAAAFGFADYYIHARSALYLATFRQYNASLGRWLTKDPAEEQWSFNSYAFVNNNAVGLIDRTGFGPQNALFGAGVGAEIGGISGTIGGAGAGTLALPGGGTIAGGVAGGAWGAAGGAAIGGTMGWYVPDQPGLPPITIPFFWFPPAAPADNHCKSKPKKSNAPDNAWNPNGPKAPGYPGMDPTLGGQWNPPSGGPQWVPNPNGAGSGWLDGDGNVWVPTGPDSKGGSHGGSGWDVQFPDGGYTNIYPGGRVRPGS